MPGKNSARFYYGRSMEGTFRPGDCLAVEPLPLSGIRPGDVVVYRSPDHHEIAKAQETETEEVVHRVIAIAPGGLVTRGDNNPRADECLVTAGELLGRVTHFERYGDGQARPVRSGRWGLLHAQTARIHRRAWKRIWRLTIRLGQRPYHWLRGSGLVGRLWQPAFMRVRVATENGPLVKYVCNGQTVARWWPEEGRFECRQPYDLVLWREALSSEGGTSVRRVAFGPAAPFNPGRPRWPDM